MLTYQQKKNKKYLNLNFIHLKFCPILDVNSYYSYCACAGAPAGLHAERMQQRPQAQGARLLQEGDHPDLRLRAPSLPGKLGEGWTAQGAGEYVSGARRN